MFGFNGECSPQSGFWGLFLFLKLNYMATVVIPDKICPHCNGNKWRIEYKTLAAGNKVPVYRCAVRAIERSNRWKSLHSDNVREHNIKSCKRRREKGYFKTPKERERSRLITKKERDELSDNYIYRLIFNDPEIKNLKRSDVPQKLIETKRMQLLLTRQLKQLQK